MKSLYRGLLLLYPRSYRREYGGAMIETFAERAADAARQGRLGGLRLLAWEAGGVIRGAAREHLAGRRHPRGHGHGAPAGPGGPPTRPGRRGIEALGSELRQAARRLRRSPGFTAVAVLALALGIGGNAAIFTVVNSIVVSPLPYPDADRLVAVGADIAIINAHGIEIPIGFWLGYRGMSQTFDEIGLFQHTSVNLAADGDPERLEALAATASLFGTLEVAPALGRPLLEADEAPGAPPVAVLSHRLWTRRHDTDPSLVGDTIRIDGVATQIVGVMPEGFAFPRPETQLWLPLTIDRGSDPQITFSYSAIGRLADGVSAEQAREDLAGVTRRLPEMFGNVTAEWLDSSGVSPSIRSYKSKVIGTVAETLWLLLGALAFLLLIACANVANLFLARTRARRREIGLRAALGAGRGDLIRSLLAESLLVGALAGAAGLGLAVLGLRALVAVGPAELPRLYEVGIGAAEIAFTATISLLAAAAFGLLPALRLAGGSLVDQLREGGERATEGAGARRATALLVVAQTSLALLLVAGAALFARSLGNLTRIDPGFRADGVLTFRLSLPEATYPGAVQRAGFHQQVLDRLSALPGVEAAGLARCLPLQGWCGGNVVSSPDSPPRPDGDVDVVSIKPVSPGYFQALGMTMKRGRAIERRDHEARTGAAVLSEALADRLFPGMDPIGKRIHPCENGPTDEAGWYTVVGVARTVKRVQLDEEPAKILYLPMLGTDGRCLPMLDEVAGAVRTAGDPTALSTAVREAVRAIDDDVPVAAFEPLAAVLSRATARVAFTVTLLGIAAAAAALLGAIGIYGVVSHAVARRTAEIGVRMALGARRGEVARMVLRQGLGVALAGVVLGTAGALALARVLRSMLYQVSPEDPLTLASVSIGLLAVAALASYLPARRAARIDPVAALRNE